MALVAHPEVEAASAKVGQGGKVDLDALGLGRRVHNDDAFLNQVQVKLRADVVVDAMMDVDVDVDVYGASF